MLGVLIMFEFWMHIKFVEGNMRK